ncbi:hypothetical protein PHAVU_008G115000 [Phaseolus vulgaris]|uniref:DUF674 family protein n=1 Tax=Phaseolus vulgaris TaxID=3885 RepID=V7B3J5_PHAVU|nr:hypothetical protein PHAVU_008G115000g [Phaseolus vulgaris]ESW12462.1 hypothetical protein PHAVU_008G115000g [Phaseolus vulgaris]
MSDEVPLILMVEKKTHSVICAGANKEFLDVLYSFLTMPLGTIARLVQQDSLRGPVQVGSLNTLYESVVNLNKEYLCSDTCKEMLVRPRNSAEHHCRSLKLNIDDTDPTSYFICPNFHECGINMLSTFKNQRCECGNIMDHILPFQSQEAYQGFLRDGTTFIITDNLHLVPNIMYEDIQSLRSFFDSFLKRNEGDGVLSLEIIDMNVNKRQILDLLKCSLLSKTALSHFFFVNKPILEGLSYPVSFVGYPCTLQIKVKIVVRKSNRKILYAEGAEDFAEFLSGILTLPLGGVVRLLRAYSSIGCVDNLYNSIDGLIEEKFFVSKEDKCRLLYPNVAQHFQSNICKQMFPICEHTSTFYCDENHKMKLVDPKSSSEGFFKVHANLPAMFIVTDDLVVAPASLMSGYALVKRLKISLRDVIEKNVTIGIKEGFGILKASLTSRSALTNGLWHLLANFNEENGFVIPVWCKLNM